MDDESQQSEGASRLRETPGTNQLPESGEPEQQAGDVRPGNGGKAHRRRIVSNTGEMREFETHPAQAAGTQRAALSGAQRRSFEY